MTHQGKQNRSFLGLTRKSEEQESVAQKEYLRLAALHKRAVERLEYLYEISRLLAGFESVEKTFPKILELTAGTFPLRSAILIQRRGEASTEVLWPSQGLDEDHRKTAIDRAETSLHYLSSSFSSSAIPESVAQHPVAQHTVEGEDNYLIFPLVVINMPVFGVIQLEGTHHLDEEDLRFANAFANLIAVALDRQYLVEQERKTQRGHLDERSTQLTESQGHVTALEIERDLRERFVSTLSHDLRTPLTAARLNAQLILKNADPKENHLAQISRVLSNIDRVDQMIRDLLDANRIRAGEKVRLDMAWCDLRATAAETIEFLETVHGDRFVLQSAETEIFGYWNCDALRRIFENLLGNAVKYGHVSRPVIVSLQQEGETVLILVHNDGDPIPLKDQAGLFKHFKRIESSARSSKNKGWGLGLALVEGLVQAHGGKVRVQSQPEKGTTFIVELPKDGRRPHD